VNPTEEYYDDIARNLVSGHGYTEDPAAGPNLWRAPLYPLFVAGLYSLFGFSDVPVFLAQGVFDALTCVLVYLIARRIFSEPVAVVSAVGTALYPFFSYYAVRVFSESMFTLLLALVVWFLVRAYRSLTATDFMLLGLSQGLALLCKASLELFPLVILAGLLLLRKGSTRTLGLNFSVMLVVTGLTIVPWSVRNYQVTGRIIPVSIGGGHNFWLSNHLPTGGLDDDQLDPAGRQRLAHAITGIIGDGTRVMTPENDRRFLRTALAEMLQSPAAFLALQAEKFFRFWFSAFNPANKRFERFILAVQVPVLLLAGLGIIGSLKAYRVTLPLLLVIAYFVAVNTLVPVTTLRYAIPIMPYVIMFAVWGAKELASRVPHPGPLNGVARFLAG